MIEVTLTDQELAHAARAGVDRQLRAIADGRKDAYGFKGDPWKIHIEGAMGEMALAKALGRYWSGAGEGFGEDTDVGGVQVRTRSKHSYELYVWPKDEDDAVYVLVTGAAPTFRVHGWIRGREAKREDWFKSLGRAPAYFVPQSALKPFPSPKGAS